MSKRNRTRVPKYSYTYTGPDGKRRKEWVSLAVPVSVNSSPWAQAATTSNIPEATVAEQVPAEEKTGDEPLSHYAKAKRQEVAKWSSLRDLLLETAFENEAPSSQNCAICEQLSEPLLRCRDCRMGIIFCRTCFFKIHGKVNMFHCAEEWKNGAFWPITPLWELLKNVDCCGTQNLRYLTIWDNKGRPHITSVQFCPCEDECVTLLRHGLWPGTPQRPKVAYSCELLDWLEALQLECHVSTIGFCNALRWKNRTLNRDEIKTLYRVLVSEAFEEYRHYKFRMRNISSTTGDSSTYQCPACPKDRGSIYISMDANFGLVQKKSSGSSVESPKHGSALFVNQEEADHFVDEYGNADSKVKGGECNNFQAGDKVRSKVKNQKLRYTGVFGCSCKHEIPLAFINLRHGERLAYVVHLMNLLESKAGPEVDFHLLYDIACVLEAHLKKTKQMDKLAKFQLAIPVFHCYGHKSSCQVKYSPRRQDGLGLLDGELMERLWSYLRAFNKITKEMTPSHRVDLLTDALLHWRERKLDHIDETQVQRIDRATKLLEVCDEKLADLLARTSTMMGTGCLTPNDVAVWMQEEQRQLESTRKSKAEKEQVCPLSAYQMSSPGKNPMSAF